MKKLFSILLILTMFQCSFVAHGQIDHKFERLSNIDGLSSNYVNSIIQDRVGFLWIGTQEGLNRYDGFNFKQLYNEPSNPNSLISGNISTIYQCSKGYLWFGTMHAGLNRFDPFKNEYLRFENDEENESSISSNSIKQIKEDASGNFWIATSGGGLNYLISKSGEFKRFQHQDKNVNSISSNEVNAIEIDKNGNLWIGTGTNLDYFDPEKNVFIHYVLGFESFDQSKRLAVKTLFLDSKNLLWIGTSDGLFTFSKDRNFFQHHKHFITDPSSISDDNITSVFEDSFGTIWVGTEHGLNKYLPDQKAFVNILSSQTIRNSLSSNKISYLYEDQSHILWIGTTDAGINKLDLKQKKFLSIGFDPNTSYGLPNPNVLSLYGDTIGNIWVGTDGGGLFVFNREKKIQKSFMQKLDRHNLLSDDQIFAIYFAHNKIWLGMQTGGLNVFESVNGNFHLSKYFKTKDSTGLANNQVNSIFCDKDGTLWLGTRDGLNKMFFTNGKQIPVFSTYKKSYLDSNSISDNDISAVYQDHKGFIWIATFSNGLNRLNVATGKIDQFKADANNPNSLSVNNINSIFEDHFGILWIATSGGGLCKLNSDNATFERFLMKDGLASNDVMSVLEDHSGFLWIGTSKGLSKLNPTTREFTTFDVSDGLISDAFNRSAAYKDEMGWLYFGTKSGLIYFNPAQIELNNHKPEIVITSFNLLRQNEWANSDLFISKYNANDNKIVLDYDKNIFSIEFAALDFTNPQKNRFQYKIDGVNKHWIDYGNKRSIMVTNLEPGNYILQIRGTNSDNVLNEEGLSIPIVVNPPFWRKTGFIIFILILIVFIFISIYSYLIKLKTNKILALKNQELEHANRRLIESENNLKELNNTKDKFFSIIAHDLRNPFNPLLSLTELLDDDYSELSEKERVGYIKEIRQGAKKLYDLLENLLNWALSQTKQIKFNPDDIDLNEIIQSNIELLGINAEKKGIVLNYSHNKESIVHADQNMLNSTVRNLLNNAIKFSPDNSAINILLTEDSGDYIVEIQDNGPGIPEENKELIFNGLSSKTMNNAKGKGTGLGLILCKEFVEKNGGRLWLRSTPGSGSSFFFSLKKSD